MSHLVASASGVNAAFIGSLATTDQLESLLVALFALLVREVVYWFTHRRKRPTPVPPPDDGGAG